MASYRIYWKTSAERDLRKIDRQYIPRIIKAAGRLAADPFPPKVKKLKDSSSTYRIRIGDIRVIYQVDSKAKEITIYYIRHRKDAY